MLSKPNPTHVIPIMMIFIAVQSNHHFGLDQGRFYLSGRMNQKERNVPKSNLVHVMGMMMIFIAAQEQPPFLVVKKHQKL